MSSPLKPVVVFAEDESEVRYNLLEQMVDLGIDCPDDLKDLTDSSSAVEVMGKYHTSGRLLAVIADLRLAAADDDFEGWNVVEAAYKLSPNIPTAIVTANIGNDPISRRLESGIISGVFRIFNKKKPSVYNRLIAWVGELLERRQSSLALSLTDSTVAEIYYKIAPIYARSNLPILIVGESGTGKESLARHIHEQSNNCRGPFVPINCGSLEDSIAFAELFGHQQGAFTDAMSNDIGHVLRASGYVAPLDAATKQEDFERWLRRGNADLILNKKPSGEAVLESANAWHNAGTLFLDEVGAVTAKVMAGVLRFLSSAIVHPVGYRGYGVRSYCRVIAATNEIQRLQDASTTTDMGHFRADLYDRLAGAILVLPPLSKRKNTELANFVRNPVVWQEFGLPLKDCSEDAIHWITTLYQSRKGRAAAEVRRGNFRTLKNLLHRAALLARADNAGEIGRIHFERALEHGTVQVEEEKAETVEEPFDEFEHIREVFQLEFSKLAKPIGNISGPLVSRLAATFGVAVAAACIECLCVERRRATQKLLFYQQREVELALIGSDTRKLFSKWIKVDDIKRAAEQHFALSAAELETAPTISRVAELVRFKRLSFNPR